MSGPRVMRAPLPRLLLLLLLAMPGAWAEEPVHLVLQWEHQSQFAGYYMALEQGLYRNEGLDVTITPGGAHVAPFERLRKGQADFCTAMLSGALGEYRDHRGDLVLNAQVFNRSSLAIVAWTSGRDSTTSITEPKDLDGRRVSLWQGFLPPYQCFFERFGVTPEVLPQHYTLSLFLHRGVDACSAMLYNEYHVLMQAEVPAQDLTVFEFHKHGINLPEDGIYCLRKTREERPDVCAAFARASMAGWDYAKAHQAESLDVVMRYVDDANLPTNRAHMKWMLEAILEAVYPADGAAWDPGVLSEKSYEEALAIMNLADAAPAYGDFTPWGRPDGPTH